MSRVVIADTASRRGKDEQPPAQIFVAVHLERKSMSLDRNQIALDAAHRIDALPGDLPETQRIACIQVIVLSAMAKHSESSNCIPTTVTLSSVTLSRYEPPAPRKK